MALLLAVLISAACMWISARQLWVLTRFLTSCPLTLLQCGRENPACIPQVLRMLGPLEARLADALLQPPGPVRSSDLQDELLEIEMTFRKGERTPALATRIASSAGFLCSAMYLRRALSEISETEEPVFDGVLLSAVNVVSVGVASALVCAAIHRLCGTQLKRKLHEWTLAMDYLERWSEDDAPGA
jgi:hypothetical protein